MLLPPTQFPLIEKHPEERLMPPAKDDVAIPETVSLEVEAVPDTLRLVVVAFVVVALPAISPALKVWSAVHVLRVPRPAPPVTHVPFTEKQPDVILKPVVEVVVLLPVILSTEVLKVVVVALVASKFLTQSFRKRKVADPISNRLFVSGRICLSVVALGAAVTTWAAISDNAKATPRMYLRFNILEN